MNAILDFIAACPLLDHSRPIFVDYSDGLCYVIRPSIDLPQKSDVLGNITRKLDFRFCMRAYASDDSERLVNAQFMTNFAQWIQQCDHDGLFPVIAPNTKGKSLKILNPDGDFLKVSEDGIFGLYEITIRFVYKTNSPDFI